METFSRYWHFVRGIHRSQVNSTHKGQWRGALMFFFICAWIKDWVNNHETGDLRHHRAHYEVIVMELKSYELPAGTFGLMYNPRTFFVECEFMVNLELVVKCVIRRRCSQPVHILANHEKFEKIAVWLQQQGCHLKVIHESRRKLIACDLNMPWIWRSNGNYNRCQDTISHTHICTILLSITWGKWLSYVVC